MRFSDFLLVGDPGDLDFIVGYTEDENIRISVSDFFGNQIDGSGNPGYIPVFTSTQVLGNSQIFQDGANIVIGGVNAMGYRLAVGGSLYAANGAVIESSILGSNTFRAIGEEGNSFIIPHDLDESIFTPRTIIHAPAVLTTQSATLGQVNTAISTLEGDIDILLDLKVDESSVGAPNGVASLDSGGKVPLSEIPDSIIGQVQYMGTWNAFTNTPTLNPLVPEEKGHYYVVSAAGVFGGVDYQVGDWIISNGVIWEKVDNTDAVTSVFGRIGAILALEGDYQAFYPRLSQTYDNPTWINTLAFTKITGVPAFLLENQTITLSGDVTGSGKTSIVSTISNNAVTDSKLRDSVGTSVIGRSASTTGDPADIQATTDGHVLLRSAGNLLFGLISGDSISSIDWSKITGTPTTLSGYGITNAYTKTESDNKFVPYTGASANVNLGSNNITANSFIKAGGTSSQFLKADGSVDTSQYVPTTRSVNAGTGLTGGGNLSSDITIAFDTTWGDNRYAYRTRQLTINGTTYDLSADRTWTVGTVNTLTTIGTSGPATLVGNTLNIPNYSTDLTGYVPYTGATQNLNLGTYGLLGDFVQFNTAPTLLPTAQGTMYWDADKETIDVILNGTTGSIFQDTFFFVKNQTGVTIPKGTVVRANGTVGASGRILIAPFLADGTFDSKFCLGVTTEEILNGADGRVTYFGAIRKVDTSAYPEGTVLYASPTVAGGFTDVEPAGPTNNIISVAIVIYSDNNNGEVFVRPTFIDSANDIAQSLGYTPANAATTITINGTTYDLSANRSWSVGTVTSVAALTLGTSGTDLSSSVVNSTTTPVITLNVPTASAVNRGALSAADWTTFNSKQNAITLTTTGTSGVSTLVGSTLNIPNYSTDLSGYVTLGTDQTITGLKTILRGGDVLNFKIGTDTLYGLKVAYNQNELAPSGEATWSFVNTFNNGSGTGLETTPISFFRGVLVTGQRLVSASVNSNLLDYYGNNPSGRYPIYAYNTGVQQFASSIIVGETTGVVDAITGAIADLPAGVVANFKGRVIGSNAVNNDEFATLGQVTSTSRAAISLTTTGTSGPATYSSVTGVLNIPEYQGGVTSFNTRTGAVTLTSSDVTTALGYTPVTDARTLTINGVTYDLTANRTWTVGVNPSAREIETFIATSGQTVFTVTGGYTVGLVDVYINGVRLTSSDYTATNGTTVVLTVGTMVGNIVDIIKYTSGLVNSISGTGTTNELAYFTASTTIASLSTATYPSLAELSYVKGVTSSIQTQLNNKQNTLTNPVTGTGTTNYLPKFTGASTIGNSIVSESGSNISVAGSLISGGSNKFVKIGNTAGIFTNSTYFNDLISLDATVLLSREDGLYTGAIFTYESASADNVGIVSNGSIRMVVNGTANRGLILDRSGNLLVGTTTDNGARLQVSGQLSIIDNTNNSPLNWSRTGGPKGYLYSDGDNVGITNVLDFGAGYEGILLNTSSSSINFYTNGVSTPRLTLASTGAATFSGNVFISKATPLLVLNDTSGSGAQIGSFGGNLNLIDNATGTKGMVMSLSTGAATFSQNSNSTTSNTFENTNTTNTNTRNILNITAGTVSLQLQAIHGDNVYLKPSTAVDTYLGYGNALRLASTGAATFNLGSGEMRLNRTGTSEFLKLNTYYLLTDGNDQLLGSVTGSTYIYAGSGVSPKVTIASTGAATFGGNAISVTGANPSITLTGFQANLYSYLALNAGTASNVIYTLANSYATTGPYIAGALALDGTTSAGISIAATNASGLIRFYTGGTTERMRISSGGFLKASNNGVFVQSTQPFHEIISNQSGEAVLYIYNSSANPYGTYSRFSGAAPNNGTNYFMYFDDNSVSPRFVVYSNGGIANYQANDTNLSDERTKKDIEPLESYWDKFKAIEIVKFKYKDQTHDDFNIGVIAQQVEAVAPEFVDVDGWNTKPELDEEGNEIVSEEEPLKSIYTADLHHATIKVLQEAMQKIESLQQEIDTLKNQ